MDAAEFSKEEPSREGLQVIEVTEAYKMGERQFLLLGTNITALWSY